MITDVKLVINGRTWRFIPDVDGLFVSPNEGEELSEEFIVVDPSTRRILTPGSFDSNALGTAILQAMDAEEAMKRQAQQNARGDRRKGAA